MTALIELARIRLAPGRSEAELLAASNAFQSEFLAHQPGFLRRDLVRDADGGYLDIVLWADAAAAAAIMHQAATSPACASYFAVMDMGEGDMSAGVAHHAVLASYA